MSKSIKTAISPTRVENYSQWYQNVIKEAELAENSAVRGCMIIKPWGYSIWENIKNKLDIEIKQTGHKNFYCPLFIPLNFLEKESKQVKGFAKECAVVTHTKLAENEDGKLVPAGKLQEPLIIRPTSEAIIGDIFSRWIKSHRDLPLLLNQWSNVVRWEMRTRMFLRTSEILWQEGHTAHASKNEAMDEAKKMLDIYKDVSEQILAIPVISGEKTSREKFPGADITYTIEAMMQDNKALQAGTSHFLGQNFSKAFDIKFTDKENNEQLVWTTSWGVTTRLIGSVIMSHSDDNGLILPPKISPINVVIIPLGNNINIIDYSNKIKNMLNKKSYNDKSLDVELDDSDDRPGNKRWKWIKKGIPFIIEVGKKEIEKNQLCITQRNMLFKGKLFVNADNFVENISKNLECFQNDLLKKAEERKEKNTSIIKSKEEFYKFFNKENPGFAIAPWSDDKETEIQLKEDLKVTPRCIPNNMRKMDKVNCIFTGSEESNWTLFARSY